MKNNLLGWVGHICAMIVGIACILVFQTTVSAQIIYADSLIGSAPSDGSGGNNINGTSPSTDTGGATWTSAGYGPSTTVIGLNNNWYGNNLEETATLPLTLDGTHIYTLTVNAVVPYSSNGIDFGFTGVGQAVNTSINGTISQAYMDIAGYNGGVTSFYGQSATGTTTPLASDGTTHAYSIVLDSSNGNLTFLQDGTALQTVAGALNSTQMTSITGIGLGFGYAAPGAVFTNFSLSEATAVPEPSTYLLVFGGLMALMMVRRSQLARI